MSVPANLHWDEVDSSNIKRIGHDEENKIVYVEFKDGGQYAYDDVDTTLFNRFLTAPSAGKFFHANIKNHTFERVN